MENKTRKNVRQWRKVGVKRSLTSVFLCLLCAAMLVSSMSMALPVYAQEAPCTQEEHIHGEGCYVQVTSQTLERMICTVDADAIVHQHTDFCYDEAGNLRCTLEEKEAHTHGEDCLDEEGSLICQKEELELHTHEAGCYDEEGALVCESVQVVEHVHTEECFATEEVPVDTETLTCTVTDETHEHTALCYGTWVLDCALPEHAHTEACGITAVPSQTSETSTETTEATTETTEATEATGGTTSEMETAEGNQSEYKPKLDGDNAFIDSLEIVEIVSGSAPFDSDDEPGNDRNASNEVLRTFDTAIYEVKFSTALYNAVLNEDISGYKEGRVHFEFILPATPEEAEFKLTSMGTLLTLPGVVIKEDPDNPDESAVKVQTRIVNGKEQTVQILRGSFLMKATADNPAAIGSGEQTLEVAVQVWRMSNGEKLQPEFTMWLEHNNVGADYTDENKVIHSNIVTGINNKCPTVDEENAEDKPEEVEGDNQGRIHGVEAKTVIAKPITISAEPRFNVALIRDAETVTSGRGVYDFSNGGNRAPHKEDLTHSIEGRMYCYGIVVEMIADPANPSKGMMGAAFPDEDQPITFEVVIHSEIKDNSSSGEYEILKNDYQGLLWSAGANEFGTVDKSFERNTHLKFTSCYYTPLNKYDGNELGNCYNGGDWYVELDSMTDDKGHIFDVAKITIRGFEVNFNQMPSSCVSESDKHLYWNPNDTAPDHIRIKRAIFASGELWAMVPYTSRTDENAMLPDEVPSGSTRLQADVKNVVIYHEDAKPGDPLGSNVNTTDDSLNYDSPYEKKGNLDTIIRYSATDHFWNPLTTNCQETLLDWALGGSGKNAPGQELAIAVQTNLHEAEGLNRAVGFDTLLKFDDTFFVPSSVHKNGSWFDKNTDKILWAAKPDGTGWNHKGLNPDQPGYDEEMMQATPEQLIYFESLEELQQSYICVGVLIQKRGIFGVGNNQLITRVNGTVNPEAKAGYVYMTAFTNRVWRMYDVVDAVIDQNGLTAGVVPSDSMFIEYAQTYLPKWENQSTETGIYYKDYVKASCVESYDYTSSVVKYGEDGTIENDGSENGHKNSRKAKYDSEGKYTGGSGAVYYIDSCLLLSYATSIGKSTAQLVQNPETSKLEAKREYEQGLDQRYVDYVLTPQAQRIAGETGETDNAIKTNVYIEDTIPEGMALIPGSVYWEGQTGTIIYASYPDFRGQGTITNGLKPVSGQKNPQPENKDGNGAWMELDTATEGVLSITLHNVTVTGNSITDFGRIYYSCYIDGSVKGNTQLSNTASIQSDEDMREPKEENGNTVTFDITVLRMTALTFNKSSDKLVAEWWDDLGFSMLMSNSSGTTLENVILVDTLPFNAKDGTKVHGNIVVSELSMQMLADGNSVSPTSFIHYYYTTSLDYVGCRASDLTIEEIASNWMPMRWQNTTVTEDGKILFQQVVGLNQDGTKFYEGTDIPIQVIAIAAVGEIPAGHTLNMQVKLQLPRGQAGDVLYNYLSRDGNNTVYAKTTVVSRELSGLAWYDANRNGIREDDETLWSGVQVALMQKNKEGVYVPFCYQDTLDSEDPVPVIIQTGQKVSVQKQGSVEGYKDEDGNHKTGEYLFMDLPAGNYAVCFNTGEQYTLEEYQLTQMDKGNEEVDSDASRYFKDQELIGYMVSDIELSATTLMNNSLEVSAHHDAGFCDPYELPLTGGMGTTIYYILGAVLTLPALAGLRRRRKH